MHLGGPQGLNGCATMPADPTLDLIDHLYAAALEPRCWPGALDAMAQAVGGVGAVIVPVTAPSTMVAVASPSLVEPNAAYEKHWWQHDTRLRYLRSARHVPDVVTDAGVFSDDQVRRDPFYQEFLRPHGFGTCMAQVLRPSPEQVVVVSVQRDERRGAFDADEMERFAVLGRHAARALTTTARLAEAGRATRLMSAAMHHAACGMVVLDPTGRVAHVNAAAEAVLGDGLTVRGGYLCAHSPAEQRKLDALMKAALQPGDLPGSVRALATVPISRRARQHPLLLQAISVRTPPETTAWEAVVLGPGVLILIHDPAGPLGPGAVDQFVLMGLTPGQARVADAVGSGLSASEAASHLGLAESTVRVVLKAVYDKLGLSRQSQLAVLTTRLRGMPPQ